MNIKTKLLEEYVNFVDAIKKQNTYLKILINLFVVSASLFLIFLLFQYLKK